MPSRWIGDGGSECPPYAPRTGGAKSRQVKMKYIVRYMRTICGLAYFQLLPFQQYVATLNPNFHQKGSEVWGVAKSPHIGGMFERRLLLVAAVFRSLFTTKGGNPKKSGMQ